MVRGDFESLFVDGFNSVTEQWTEVGGSPWLNDNTGNEIYTNQDDYWHEEFTFVDPSGSGTINSVTFYLELRIVDTGRSDSVEIYLHDGTGWSDKLADWNPSSTSYYWENVDVSTFLNSWTKIQDAKLKVKYDRAGSPSTVDIYLRRAYLYVDYMAGNQPPTIDSMRITETTDEIPITTLDVYIWYDWEIQVSEPDTLDDIVTLTIRIMENPSVEIDADTPDFVEDSEYWFRFVDATNTWDWYSGSDWTTTSDYLDGANCEYPTKTGTQGWYLFRVRLSKIAKKSSLWAFSALVEDSQAQTDKDKIVSITVNLYLELSVTTTTHTWSTVQAGDSDVLVDEGDLDFTVTANAVFDVQAKGDGDLADNGNTIPLSKVEVHLDTLGSATPLSISYQDIGGLTNQPAGKDLAKSFMAWLDVPLGTPMADYSYVLTIGIVEAT